jgi:uncharacterized protein (TIGR03663 family)
LDSFLKVAMQESTGAQAEPSEIPHSLLSSVTVEVGLYAVLALFAFAVRLFHSGSSPLGADEARQALASWHWITGVADSHTGSPLLFTGNALVFALFGPSDANARFIPVLAGSGLVLVPALLRYELGRLGALIASLLLAISPSLLLFSREANGAIVAVTCGAAAIAFGWRYLVERQSRDLSLASVTMALGLLSAREFWTIAAAVGLYTFVRWVRARQGTRAVPEEISDGPIHAAVVSQRRKELRRAVILFLATFVGVGTTFLLHREGVGAAFDLFGAWLQGLVPGYALYDPLRLLIIYEPLGLLFGGAALLDWVISPANREETPAALLSLWALLAFVVYTIGADKDPVHIVVVVVPLLLGAGWYLGAWITETVDAVRNRTDALGTLLSQDAPVFLFGGALIAFLYFVLAEFGTRGSVMAAQLLTGWLRTGQGSADAGLNGIAVILLILIVAAIIALLAISTVGGERAKVIGIALAVTVLSVWTIRQSAMLNYSGALNPQELIVPNATPVNVRDLVGDLESISRWRANDSHTLTILADSSLGPVVEWYLREFVNARFIAQPTVSPGTQVLLLPADASLKPSGLMSQLYPVEAARVSLPRDNLLRWLIFRDIGEIQYKEIALWIPQPR